MAREGGAAGSRLAAIDRRIATRQVKHLISDPAQGTRNRGETRARHQAPLRQLQREFYDLNKDPIVCPKCHTVMELVAVNTRARPETAPPAPTAPSPP